ncbi:MAG: tyrosine decarboxylase [Candidatus Aminicenantes bacterium]|nr:MAG: tyrosine decarboxylase [Candidatus Aminicenantes bacterium]
MKKTNVDALFLGPKSENHRFFKEMLDFMIDEHIHWRRDFHPDDKPYIKMPEQHEKAFQDTLDRTQEILLELSSKLKASSEPWFSPRYLGQMNSDILMCAALAYMATILYNPNNCAYEGAPATTPMEIDVGLELATMLGYDPGKAWGHITADGTIANYEGVWFMRNMKSFPLAVKKVKPKLVKGMSEWELLNMPPGKILDLVEETMNMKTRGGTLFDRICQRSVRGTGVHAGKLGKLLVPQTKHYSWPKAVDLLGIGGNNLVDIKVKDNYRMDIKTLENTIADLTSKNIPILGVVSVVGTTEEGAVDEVHQVVDLRNRLEKRGISFYYHIDAAYGGYTRSIFLDETGKFMEYGGLKTYLHKQGVIHQDVEWPPRDVYEAYKAIPEADSITIDPHKMGYVPYPAGAVTAKDKRVQNLVSFFAPYVFAESKKVENPGLLGAYILEGSKPGAAAAAVWAAHQTIPLDVTGYGRIIGRSIEVAHRFYHSLIQEGTFEVKIKKYKVVPLTKPDFNMVCWAFNEVGNTSLKKMNKLTLALFDKFQYVDGPVYYDDFLTSHTEFTPQSYGDSPKEFLKELGIPLQEYKKEKSLWILRASLLTPFLDIEKVYDDYWKRFMKIMKETIAQVDK